MGIKSRIHIQQNVDEFWKFRLYVIKKKARNVQNMQEDPFKTLHSQKMLHVFSSKCPTVSTLVIMMSICQPVLYNRKFEPE